MDSLAVALVAVLAVCFFSGGYLIGHIIGERDGYAEAIQMFGEAAHVVHLDGTDTINLHSLTDESEDDEK